MLPSTPPNSGASQPKSVPLQAQLLQMQAEADAKAKARQEAVAPPPNQPLPTPPLASEELAGKSPRLLSLDAFRGLVIVVMFLVNVAGRDQAFPEWFPHAGWNNGHKGNGLADFVFPWFLFIVGAAIPFSMSAGRGKDLATEMKVFHVLRRGLVIYLLGTLMWCATIGYKPAAGGKWYGPIDLDVFLHWDILPLIGFGYALASLLWLLPFWFRIVFATLVLVFKWLIFTHLHYPGEAAVVWEEQKNIQQYIHANLGWLGVMLTQGMAASCTVVLGSFAGDILREPSLSPTRRAVSLVGGGLVISGIAWAWHAFGGLPFSKDFFTSSYILVSAGTAAALLGICFVLADLKKWTTLFSLRVLGLNAIFVYVLAEFTWKAALMQWQVVNPSSIGGSSVMIVAFKAWLHAWSNPDVGSITLVALYILFYWAVAWLMFRAKIFVKV